jgi:hypothetical protein
MNLQENIRKVLREETNNRMVNLIRDSINKMGLGSTLKVFGGYDVVSEYGDIITKREKIQYIVNVCEELGGGISLDEIGDGQIPYNETKTEYSEIAYIGEFGVYVDVWGGYKNQSLIREDKVNYFKLNDKILDDIFRVSLEIANHNDINIQEDMYRIQSMTGLVAESKVYLLRRVTPDKINDEFKDSLDYASYKLKGNYGLKLFKDRVISLMIDGLHGELSNWGTDHFPYEEIEEFLLEMYSDEMTERYHQLYGDDRVRD